MNEINLDQFLEGEDLWGRVITLAPDAVPFTNQYSAEYLNTKLVLNYGDRIVFSKMIKLDINTICELIINTYSDKWKSLININDLEINIASNNTRKLNEINSTKECRENEIDNINTISAFNTDELINNDGSNTKGTDTSNKSDSRILTDEYLNYATAFNNLSLLEKNHIINIVLKDVSNLLTLEIY